MHYFQLIDQPITLDVRTSLAIFGTILSLYCVEWGDCYSERFLGFLSKRKSYVAVLVLYSSVLPGPSNGTTTWMLLLLIQSSCSSGISHLYMLAHPTRISHQTAQDIEKRGKAMGKGIKHSLVMESIRKA
jgi:hypothetical protein